MNGALPLFASDVAPPKKRVSPIEEIPDTFPPVVLCIALEPIVQFAISPALEVKVPSIIAPLAISLPLEETAKSVPNLT